MWLWWAVYLFRRYIEFPVVGVLDFIRFGAYVPPPPETLDELREKLGMSR